MSYKHISLLIGKNVKTDYICSVMWQISEKLVDFSQPLVDVTGLTGMSGPRVTCPYIWSLHISHCQPSLMAGNFSATILSQSVKHVILLKCDTVIWVCMMRWLTIIINIILNLHNRVTRIWYRPCRLLLMIRLAVNQAGLSICL